MLTRAEVLENFGLPDRAAFEMKPERDSQGMWRIKVSYEGADAVHMSQGHASKLAAVVRSVDRPLAEQIDACVSEARRCSENSN